jgi:site-specific DNA-methyltransferase (adenine-specific)
MSDTMTIMCADCVTGMRALPDGYVDIVITSPPYNLGIAYSTYDDTASRENYLDWCAQWLREVLRVLHPDGSFFLNVGASAKDPLLPHQIALIATNVGFRLQNTFHWIKSISVPDGADGIVSHGHFKPINSNRFVNDCHEYIFHLTRTGDVPLDRLALGVPYQDKSNIARWGHTVGRDRRCRGNNWFIPYETIQRRATDRPHPASFPRQLVRNCLLIAGATESSHVMDPFLGIGTTALVAVECGIRNFTGFDIDAEYIAVARARLAALSTGRGTGYPR